MTSLQLSANTARRAVLSRRIRFLAAGTISYNLVEAVVALWAGGTADSSALIVIAALSLVIMPVLSW